MKSEKSKKKLRETAFILAVLGWPLLMFCIFYIGVNGSSVLMAFQRLDKNYEWQWNGLNNFKDVFQNLSGGGSIIKTALVNNVKLFIWTFIIGFPLNMLFGYYLFKQKIGHQMVRFVIMTPSLLSGMVVSLLFLRFCETALPDIIFQLLGKKIGNLLQQENTAMPTIIFYTLWTGFTTSLIYYPNAMNAIDNSILESAMLDGATTLQELIYIIIPLIHPTITTLIVSNVPAIFTNSGPLFAFYYRSAPSYTMTMGYYLFTETMYGEGEQVYPYLSALGFMMSAITLPIVYLTKWLFDITDPMKDKEGVRKCKSRA